MSSAEDKEVVAKLAPTLRMASGSDEESCTKKRERKARRVRIMSTPTIEGTGKLWVCKVWEGEWCISRLPWADISHIMKLSLHCLLYNTVICTFVKFPIMETNIPICCCYWLLAWTAQHSHLPTCKVPNNGDKYPVLLASILHHTTQTSAHFKVANNGDKYSIIIGSHLASYNKTVKYKLQIERMICNGTNNDEQFSTFRFIYNAL